MKPSVSAALAALVFAGCAQGEPADPAGRADAALPGGVTFSEQIAPLFQDHCQSCHRPEGIAPFPLVTYDQVRPMAGQIKTAVVTRRMPHGMPVRLHTGCSDADTFQGPRRLTDDEIGLIVDWIDSGAPEGDPASLPPPRDFPDGEWAGDEPDFRFYNAPDGFALPPDLDRDVFRRFVIPTDFGRDRFITGFQAIPGAIGGSGLAHVVHHVTLFIDPQAKALDQEQAFAASGPEIPGPGFEGEFESPAILVGMWFPGSRPLRLPEGLGMRVPAGAALVIEVHYAAYQGGVTDRTEVGIHFADQVEGELAAGLVKNVEFTVPAGAGDHEVTAAKTLEAPATLHAITPHMHQLGTDFFVSIDLPGTESVCLADVQWDFEHQGTYWLTAPMQLPAGTTIRTSCVYDNSDTNPHQFNDPPADIPFGTAADREMCQLTVALHQGGDAPDAAAPRLAEVLYNASGDDDGAEWVKLYNPGDAAIDLSGYALGWGGLDYTYGTLALSGTLAPGECAIVGGGPATLPADFDPDLQNGGSAADGVALFRGSAAGIGAASVPVDAVIYGGSANGSGLVDETGAPGAVDVVDAAAGQSIRRAGDAWAAGEPAPGACP